MQANFPWQNPEIVQHSLILLDSFQRLTGKQLIKPTSSALEISQALFEANFIVVSHGVELDPILNYGNRAALDLWQLSWEDFTRTPSRLTAESIERSERDRLLAQAKQQGYISNYCGIRISSTGDRFYIENATIWNVVDDQNRNYGQAATFSNWNLIQKLNP